MCLNVQDITGWCPPIISWFITPIDYSYIYHKPLLKPLMSQLSYLGGPILYSLDITIITVAKIQWYTDIWWYISWYIYIFTILRYNDTIYHHVRWTRYKPILEVGVSIFKHLPWSTMSFSRLRLWQKTSLEIMMDKSLVITGRHGNYDISIWKSAFVTTFGMFFMNFGANFSVYLGAIHHWYDTSLQGR